MRYRNVCDFDFQFDNSNFFFRICFFQIYDFHLLAKQCIFNFQTNFVLEWRRLKDVWIFVCDVESLTRVVLIILRLILSFENFDHFHIEIKFWNKMFNHIVAFRIFFFWKIEAFKIVKWLLLISLTIRWRMIKYIRKTWNAIIFIDKYSFECYKIKNCFLK